MDDLCVWGTWEELLLASAVKRHGSDNWERVSVELQARAMAHSWPPSSFSAEACRSKYYAIKRRYCGEDEMDAEVDNDVPWFEELRNLRVAHLKKELQHYDDSIGSLQIKLKRLQAESSVANPNHVTKVAATPDTLPPAKIEQAEDVGVRSSEGQDGEMKTETHEEHKREPSDAIPPLKVHSRLPSTVGVEDRTGKCNNVTDALAASKCERKEDFLMLGPNKEGPTGACDGAVLPATSFFGDGTASITSSESVEAEIKIRSNSSTKLTELRRGSSLIIRSQGPTDRFRQIKEPRKEKENEFGNVVQTRNSWRGSLSHQENEKPLNMLVQGSVAGFPYEDNDSRHLQMDNFKTGADDEHNLRIDKEASSTHVGLQKRPQLIFRNISRLSSKTNKPATSSPISSRQSKAAHVDAFVGLPALTKFINNEYGKNDIQHDSEQIEFGDTRKQDKEFSTLLAVEECGPSLSVGSADSTGHEGTTSMKEAPSQDNKAAVELSGIIAGSRSPGSREEMTYKKSFGTEETRGKNQCTENVSLLEMSGESLEFVNSREVSGTIEQAIKLNLKTSPTKDVGSACKGDSETTDSIKPAETSTKTVSVLMSHEESGSINDEGNDIEEWQEHTERYSGDSHIEKSEAGSLMDGNEGISPMSRRHRREPKVPGKFIHLLECLRTISAHKCAALFKHKQETQENMCYDRLIRSHVDLTLVRARLEEGIYSGSIHFFRDLLLMINNTLVYYEKESQEHIAAMGLRECIRKEMSRIFQTEALLKQDRPSTRKHEHKRPNRITALVADSTSPEKKQGIKRGRTRLKVSNRNVIIPESAAQCKDGTALERTDHYPRTTDAVDKKLQDAVERNISSMNLKEETIKTGGTIMGIRHFTFEGRSRGKFQTGQRKSNILAKAPKEINIPGEAVRQASKLHSGMKNGSKTASNTLEMAVGSDSKFTARQVGKTGQALEMMNASFSNSQPVKRRVGRPPKHSVILQNIKGQEQPANQQKKKSKRAINQSG